MSGDVAGRDARGGFDPVGWRRRDPATLLALWEYVRRFAYRRLKCPHAAEDVAQEVILRLLRARPGPPDHLLIPWIIRVARHRIIDWKRKIGGWNYTLERMYRESSRYDGVVEDGVATYSGTPDEPSEIDRRVADLPVRLQIVLDRKRKGCKVAAIAAELDVSERTVYRDLEKLFSILGRESVTPAP